MGKLHHAQTASPLPQAGKYPNSA
jgi:hypothetical protein